MFLAPDGDEIEITNAAADFMANAMPIARLHAPGVGRSGCGQRQALAELGWFALTLPEDIDGSGLSAVEHALFFREAGRQSAPVDVLTQSPGHDDRRRYRAARRSGRRAEGVALR